MALPRRNCCSSGSGFAPRTGLPLHQAQDRTSIACARNPTPARLFAVSCTNEAKYTSGKPARGAKPDPKRSSYGGAERQPHVRRRSRLGSDFPTSDCRTKPSSLKHLGRVQKVRIPLCLESSAGKPSLETRPLVQLAPKLSVRQLVAKFQKAPG